VVPIDGLQTIIDETYPERVKYTQFAVYAETELATMPRLLELQINLADGSQVNGTNINRIDSTNIFKVLVPDTSGYKLFDGSFTASGFNAYRDTPGELYQNKFNTAFAATGGRLLCEGVALPLALYGSNDGTNWTRVAALDVVSVARNYGCGENTVQSCAHLPFGAAPRGAHVFRFAATDILYQSDTPLYVRDVQATLADGTEYLFPASEFSFISPRVAKPASPVNPVTAAGLPAIVQNVFFESGHWSQTFGGYKYNATQGDIYIYSVGGVPGFSKSDIRDIYFIQYNTTTRLWGDHGSNYPYLVTQTGNTVVLSSPSGGIDYGQYPNIGTFIDPYAPVIVDAVTFLPGGDWAGAGNSVKRIYYRETQGDMYVYFLGGHSNSDENDIQYNTLTGLWENHGTDYPQYVTQTGNTVVLNSSGAPNQGTFIDPYFPIVQDVYFTTGSWIDLGRPGYTWIETRGGLLIYAVMTRESEENIYIHYNTLTRIWDLEVHQNGNLLTRNGSSIKHHRPGQYPNLGTFIDPFYVEPVLALPPAALKKVYYTGGYYHDTATDPVFTYIETQGSAYVYEHMPVMSNTVIKIQYNTMTTSWEDGDPNDTFSVVQTEQTVEITNDLYPQNPAIIFTDPYYGAPHVAVQHELTGASDETVGFAWPTIDGTTLFSLTTAEPIHRFTVTFAFKDSTVAVPLGVDVYRDDVLISAASASSTSLSSISNGTFSGWDAQEHVHRVSHFLAVVGSGTNPSIAEFRATYGGTRLIAGPNDEREIMETTTLISPRVDYVFAEGIANMPNMPQSGFDGDRSTVLHKGSESDASHAYYYAFGEPIDATSFKIFNVYTGSVEAYAYDNATFAWVWLGNTTSEIVPADTEPTAVNKITFLQDGAPGWEHIEGYFYKETIGTIFVYYMKRKNELMAGDAYDIQYNTTTRVWERSNNLIEGPFTFTYQGEKQVRIYTYNQLRATFTDPYFTPSHVGEVLELGFAAVHSQYFKLVAYPHANNPDDKEGHTGFSEWIISGARGQLSLNGARNNYQHEVSAKTYDGKNEIAITDGSWTTKHLRVQNDTDEYICLRLYTGVGDSTWSDIEHYLGTGCQLKFSKANQTWAFPINVPLTSGVKHIITSVDGNVFIHRDNIVRASFSMASVVPRVVVPGLTTDGSFYYAALTRTAADLDLLFDGSLEMHPDDALQASGIVSDRVLFYAEVPKNVIPNYGEVWSDGLTHAALYFAQEVPQDASNVALWYKLVDLKRYAGYARVIGANPLYATTGAYAELGAEAVKVNGEVDTSVILEASKLPSELGVNGAHVVSYGGKRMNYSLAERDVRVGPIGPSVDGAGAPDVSDTIGATTTRDIEVSQYFTAGSGTTLRYEASTNNNGLVGLTISGSDIRLEAHPNVTGTAVITVKAIANEAYAQPGSATLTFQYVIESNGAPNIAVAIPDVQGRQILNLTNYFSDADPGHQAALVYTFTNGDSDVLNATLVDGELHLENGLFRDGTSTVVVTATDPVGASVNDTFTITFQFSTQYVYDFVVTYDAANNENNQGIVHVWELESSTVGPISYSSVTTQYTHRRPYLNQLRFEYLDMLDTILFTITVESRMTDISISAYAPQYQAGYDVFENGVKVANSTSNSGTGDSGVGTTITFDWGPPRPTSVPQVMFTSGAWAQKGVFNKPNGAPGYQFYKTQGEHLDIYYLITQSQGRYDIAYNTLSKTWQTASTQPGEVLQFEDAVSIYSNVGDTNPLGVFIDPYYMAPLVRYGGPHLVSAMPSVVVDRNASFKTFSAASYFNTTKLPASALRYYYSINNDALVSINEADQDGGTFNIVPRGTIGVALVTVRAVALERDVDTWVAETSFNVTIVVDDDDPTVIKAFPNVYASQVINLSNYFKDDDNDLTYTVTVSDASVVTAAITGTSLSLEDATSADGTAAATVTVTARDSNAEASSSITIDFAFSRAYQFADHVALKSAVDACIQAVPSGIGCYAANPNICGAGVNCGEIDTWDVSLVTDMNMLFADRKTFNADISKWNTAAVTNMENMFNEAHAFSANISAWNTASVTSMHGMFFRAIVFDADISGWSTSAVTRMSLMFGGTNGFNADISGWDTAAVTDMSYMFYDAIAFNADISGWDTSAVTNMENMFNEAHAFSADISAWNTAAVTRMGAMFNEATNFNRDIGAWNTAAVTSMINMFKGASAFNADISGWSTPAVTTTDNMFLEATAWNNKFSRSGDTFGGPPDAWALRPYQFPDRTTLKSAVNACINAVASGIGCYAANPNICDGINCGEIDTWDVSLVTNMNGLFDRKTIFNADISLWNTAAVTSMYYMFHQANAFAVNIAAWNTARVVSMRLMFYSANSFNADISAWSTSEVYDMHNMFSFATAFNADIRTWDIGASTDVNNMFKGATAWNALYERRDGSVNGPPNAWTIQSGPSPPFEMITPLLFTRGDWFVDGYTQAYVFHEYDKDLVIYKLSWNDDESYFIQYNITTTEWKDDGLSHPYGVYEEGSEVILTSPGFNPKGAFENPYL
jgi:surface protein